MRGIRSRREELLKAESISAAICRAAVAPVLAQPTTRAEQVTQLVLGETGSIEERSGDWRRLSLDIDGYSGWVNAGYLQEADTEVAVSWRVRASGWSEGASLLLDGRSLPVPLRARLPVEGTKVVLPDGQRARVAGGKVRTLSEVRAEAGTSPPERWALEHFFGSPYLWGGVTPWGVDCSGLVQTTFAARGMKLPRDSAQQAGCGEQVTPEAIQPGDLLFFRGETSNGITHVAFAGEDETLVHSTIACGGVVMESWKPGSRAEYLRSRLVVARRLERR